MFVHYTVFQDLIVGASRTCFRARDTNVWKPDKLTTFMLPVITIESLVKKLSEKRYDLIYKNATSETVINGIKTDTKALYIKILNKAIANWKKVLSNYRSL